MSDQLKPKLMTLVDVNWVLAVLKLLEPIANWERKNGTAAALVGWSEQAQIGTIIQKWAGTHHARQLIDEAPDTTINESHAISVLSERITEMQRLRELSNQELVQECLESDSDAADFPIVEEMMCRLHPNWEKNKE